MFAKLWLLYCSQGEQNKRICKNIVLMATRFHSTSGFHLSLLIGENVTINVLLWMLRETTSRVMLLQPMHFIGCYKKNPALTHTFRTEKLHTLLNSFEWERRAHTHAHTLFFLSKTHLAHHDRVISSDVFITESQVFNMSHISGPCACQEAPHVQAALCQVEQEERETEYEKEKRERWSVKKRKRDRQSLLVLYIDLLTLYILYEPVWAIR